MIEQCKERITCVFRSGTFRFELMHFGLMNGPSTVHRMLDGLLGHLRFVLVYLQDMEIFLSSMDEHVEHSSEVLNLVFGHVLKDKTSKCEFSKSEVSLL